MIETLTKEDLLAFKSELLQDLRQIIVPTTTPKKWLKSYEVRQLLSISQGTLQNLRHNGTLKYTRVGSIFFYSHEDIEKLLKTSESGKI